MRRRLPGLLGRVGGIVAVDANRFWQRILKSPSAEADAVSQSVCVACDKVKCEFTGNLAVTCVREPTHISKSKSMTSNFLMQGAYPNLPRDRGQDHGESSINFSPS